MDLLERCKVLKEYMYFVDKVQYYVREQGDEQADIETAIEQAIDDCIENHILEDFLKSRREEVVKVTQLDYTWERREELIRREEYEEGLEVGTQRGIEVGIERGITEARLEAIEKMIKKKYSKEDILDLGYTEEEYQAVEQKFVTIS